MPNLNSVTVCIDHELFQVFREYCFKNRKVKSASAEISTFIKRTIATKGRKYGLQIPPRLQTK